MKFKNELKLDLRKVIGILEIYDFLMLIHKCRFFERV